MLLNTFTKSALAAAVIGATLFSGVALARDPAFTARLAAPVSEQTRIVALNALWTCDGDTCVARPTHAATVRACRQFVNEVGAPVTAYGTEARQLSSEELARCNAVVGETNLEARN